MTEETEDVTRKPYFLIDGDTLGFVEITPEKPLDKEDDLQTEEDKEKNKILEIALGKEGKRISKEQNFKLNVDF